MLTVEMYTSVINQLLPEPHAGLLNGILFGYKATLSKSFLESLTKTGTLHIVALSGMNISILASLVSTTVLRLFSRRIASLLTILIIIGFVWFVGASPSVVRAAIMGCISLIAVVFGRQLWGLLSFAITVGVMLLFRPAWIGELSFQLSALATLGIILFGSSAQKSASKGVGSASLFWETLVPTHHTDGSPRSVKLTLQSSKKSFPHRLLHAIYLLVSDDLRVTLAAQVFTIPLIFFVFHRVSLISPLTNILIGWVISPLTALGMAVAVVGWVWLPAGQVLAWAAWVLLQYLITFVALTARIPFSSIGW